MKQNNDSGAQTGVDRAALDLTKTGIVKIVSGAQTGVDRAALDFAINNGIPHGGFCPRGRLSESGRISDKYNLVETSSSGYRDRTRKNVLHSDGTLIITRGRVEGGTGLTFDICGACNKPRLVVKVERRLEPEKFVQFVRQNNIRILNVAGPRERKQKGIGKETIRVLTKLFEHLAAV